MFYAAQLQTMKGELKISLRKSKEQVKRSCKNRLLGLRAHQRDMYPE